MVYCFNLGSATTWEEAWGCAGEGGSDGQGEKRPGAVQQKEGAMGRVRKRHRIEERRRREEGEERRTPAS